MADINIGAISEALNNKTDRNMRNVDTGSKADSVIDFQLPTAENGYTWYRKYASGWVEQGGLTPSGTGAGTVTLPVVMANNNYQFLGNVKNSTTNTVAYTLQARTLTTTTAGYFKSYNGGGAVEIFWWQVSGMAA